MPLQLRSIVRTGGELELSLAEVPMPVPKADEVLVRIEAAPMNPSDLMVLFGMADMSTARAAGTADRPVVTATVPPRMLPAVAGRLNESVPVGRAGGPRGRHVGHAEEHHQVRRIHRGRVDAHEHLLGFRFEHRHLGEREFKLAPGADDGAELQWHGDVS